MGNRQGKRNQSNTDINKKDGGGDDTERNNLVTDTDPAPGTDSSLHLPGNTTELSNGTPDFPFDKYVYPFENIVFEGGGNKGLAYCGAVRLLEEAKIWPQITRLAGTSAGAMTAAILAVGYNSYDLEKFLSQDLQKIFVDHKFGYLSFLPNLMKKYGWNPGRRMSEWFGKALKDKTGDANITFMQLYERFGKELCVVVTNVNHMCTEYCHPKTTPDMPIRIAVRMSMAIPGMFKAVKYTRHSYEDVYVDGGVLCNYPIHCFDGWWLSMKPQDSHLRRLQPVSDLPRLFEKNERFGSYNEKTLGFLLYSENEPEILQIKIEERDGKYLSDCPKTKLANKRVPQIEARKQAAQKHDDLLQSVDRFLKMLRDNALENGHGITKDDLSAAISMNKQFTEKDMQLLFGEDANVDDIFTQLDANKNLTVTSDELLKFLDEKGVNLWARFLGYHRRDIQNLNHFASTLQEALLLNTKRIHVEERDVQRTVGINTYYLETMDFKMEVEDKALLMEQGRHATKAYLLYFISNMRPLLRTDKNRLSFNRDLPYFADDDITEIIDERDYMENYISFI